MAKTFHNFFIHKSIQVTKIANHAGMAIDLAAHGHFQRVIMAVSMGIVAFAVDGAVFFRRHGITMQPVRR